MTLHVMGQLWLAATTKKTTTSSNGLATLLFYVVIVGVGYVLWRSLGRNRRMQAAQTRDLLSNLSAGDEVLTGAGIFGTVLDVEGDRVTIETAPGTRITVLRSTIARRIEEEPPPTGAASLDELGEEPGVVREQREHDEHDEHDDGHPDGSDAGGEHPS